MKPQLNKSQVSFDPEEHTYRLGTLKLSGITSILSKYLFAKKYDAVDPEVLAQAAEHGSKVHSEIECVIMGFEPNTPMEETIAYKELMATTPLEVIDSEYLVSDNNNVASSIDIVAQSENGIELIDIKTTSVLDKDYLAWQLSIYAYLFELNNPDLKVTGLHGLHLRGSKAKMVDIQRIEDKHVIALLRAFVSGADTFSNPLQEVSLNEEEMLARVAEIETSIIELKSQIDLYEAKKKEFNDRLLTMMDERGITKWETERLTITRKADSTRTSVDTKKLQAEYPDAYKACEKQSTVKGSILIKIK